MFQALILWRVRREPLDRPLDSAAVESRLEGASEVGAMRRRVPLRRDLFGIDRAVRQIPGIVQIGVGAPDVEIDRVLPIERLPRGFEVLRLVIRRIQSFPICGAERAHQIVDRGPRTSAVAPREPQSVAVIEAARLLPYLLRTRAADGRRPFRVECTLQAGLVLRFLVTVRPPRTARHQRERAQQPRDSQSADTSDHR